MPDRWITFSAVMELTSTRCHGRDENSCTRNLQIPLPLMRLSGGILKITVTQLRTFAGDSAKCSKIWEGFRDGIIGGKGVFPSAEAKKFQNPQQPGGTIALRSRSRHTCALLSHAVLHDPHSGSQSGPAGSSHPATS